MGARPGTVAFLLAFSICTCAPGPQTPELAFQGRPIINGEPDTDAAHRAVVLLYMGSGSYGYLCTGTLIARDTVLTAAHCVASHDPADINVMIGEDLDHGTWSGVSDKLVHPDYDGRVLNDIAMVRLSRPPAFVTPIPHLPDRLKIATSDIGRPLEFIGYGETESGGTGVKLTVTNDLDWICTETEGCGGANPGQLNTICSDMTPGGPCHGDSGGPALVLRGGRAYVAGVTSYGDEHCEYFGCSTKVDAFEEFINDYAGGYLGAPCEASADCTSGFCVDGVCCDTSCASRCKSCVQEGSEGFCITVPNGTTCPDGDLCNGDEVCLQGECVPGPPPDCEDDNPCTGTQCDPASGCLFAPLPEGTPCANQTVCDGDETCVGGACRPGTSLDCQDHNPCTEDSCDPQTGCVHEPLADGADCGGGSCGPASCVQGRCVSGDPSTCDDGDPCTRDWCDPSSGCQHADMPEGYPCGSCRGCIQGVCTGLPDCEQGGCGCGGHGRRSAVWLVLVVAISLVVRRR